LHVTGLGGDCNDFENIVICGFVCYEDFQQVRSSQLIYPVVMRWKSPTFLVYKYVYFKHADMMFLTSSTPRLDDCNVAALMIEFNIFRTCLYTAVYMETCFALPVDIAKKVDHLNRLLQGFLVRFLSSLSVVIFSFSVKVFLLICNSKIRTK
jgi:hypothetical protein